MFVSRIYILLNIIVAFAACNNPISKKAAYQVPSKQDIDAIVSLILKQQHLDLIKQYNPNLTDAVEIKRLMSKRLTNPISTNLVKIMLISATDTNRILPDFRGLPISQLMEYEVDDKKFIMKSDTSYLLFQNNILKEFKLNLDSTVNSLTTLKEEQKKEKVSYYDLSIPIFSMDNKSAYVEFTYNCSGLCGNAVYYLLKKVNNKWTIVVSQLLWIS